MMNIAVFEKGKDHLFDLKGIPPHIGSTIYFHPDLGYQTLKYKVDEVVYSVRGVDISGAKYSTTNEMFEELDKQNQTLNFKINGKPLALSYRCEVYVTKI
jgi:hypothetical protein